MSYAVITGASSGIGEEFAVQLAQRGHNLILLARRADRLSELAQRLSEQYGISAEILPADLADTQKLEVVADILRTRTDIAYLINNAGFGSDGMIWESDHQRQLDMLTVHTVAPYTLCRAVIPQMLNNNHGKIINVSSIAGFFHGEVAQAKLMVTSMLPRVAFE